jgi:autotransporter-associated beta strand protein
VGAAALILLAGGVSQAATVVWDGGGIDANWTTANNWSTNAVWNSSDSASFGSGFVSGTVINLNGSKTVASLIISTTTDFSLNNNTLTLTSGDITRTAATGTTTLNSAVALGNSAIWNIAGNLVAHGIISGSQSLTKTGSGTLTLTAANIYTGDTTISDGILNLRNSAALGNSSGNAVVNDGGELQLQGGISVSSGETLSLTGIGAGGVGSAALRNISGNNTWAGTITLQNDTGPVRIHSDSGTLTLGAISESGTRNKILTFGGAGDVLVTGIISGGGRDIALTKEGAGTLTLSAANTYTGNTTVLEGILKLTNTTAIPGGIGASGGRANLIIDGGILGLGANDFQRGVGTGAAQVQFTGSGGFAAYTADRNVNLGGSGPPSTVTWGSGGFIPTGSSLILGAADSDKTVTFQNPVALNGAVRTVQVNDGSAAVDAVLSGALSGTGASGLAKTGSGTLNLTAASSFTGATSVSGGKLTVTSTGSINSTSGISIAGGGFNYNSATALSKSVTFTGTGGTLGGSGTITPAVTVTAGNTYSAGTDGDPGTQTLAGGLSLAAGSIFHWDLDATSGADPGVVANSGIYDKVTGNGGGGGVFHVVLGSNLFTSPFWDTDKSWTDIFSGSDPVFTLFGGGDGVASVASNGLVAGQGRFSYTGGSLTWTAVPEPTGALVVMLLGAGLLRRRRPAAARREPHPTSSRT